MQNNQGPSNSRFRIETAHGSPMSPTGPRASRFYIHEQPPPLPGSAIGTGEDQNGRVRIGPLVFSVSFRDVPQEEQIEVTVDLIPADSREPRSATAQLTERLVLTARRLASGGWSNSLSHRLTSVIMRRVQQICAQQITQHDFYFALDGKLTAPLRETIAEEAQKSGFIIQRVQLTPLRPNELSAEPFTATTERHYEIARDESVPIYCRVLAQLLDAGQYSRVGSPRIQAWLDKVLDATLGQAIFHERRSSLLLNWPAIAQRIQSEVHKRGGEIGYTIHAVVAEPAMVEWAWSRPFEIDLGENQKFEIRDDGPKVPLRVLIAVEGINLARNALAIDQRRNLPAEMQAAVLGEVRRFLRTVSPEQYHMSFETVSGTLEKVIHRTLEDQFSAGVRQIDIIPLQTVEAEKLQQLLALPDLRLEPHVQPVHDPRSGAVELIVDMQITAVDSQGWSRFRHFTPEVAQIKEGLTSHLESELRTVPLAFLYFVSQDERLKLEEIVRPILDQAARSRYGLSVRLVLVDRKATPREALETSTETAELAEVGEEISHRRKLRSVARQHELDMADEAAVAARELVRDIQEQERKLLTQIDRLNPAKEAERLRKLKNREMKEVGRRAPLTDLLEAKGDAADSTGADDGAENPDS